MSFLKSLFSLNGLRVRFLLLEIFKNYRDDIKKIEIIRI